MSSSRRAARGVPRPRGRSVSDAPVVSTRWRPRGAHDVAPRPPMARCPDAASVHPWRSRMPGRRSRSRGRLEPRSITSSTEGCEASAGRSARRWRRAFHREPTSRHGCRWPGDGRPSGDSIRRGCSRSPSAGRPGFRCDGCCAGSSRPVRRPDGMLRRGERRCADHSWLAIARPCPPMCCWSTTCSPPERPLPRVPRSCSPMERRASRCWWLHGRSCAPVDLPILDRALVRVCGCPGIIPGSRCQPRAKRPT